MDTFEKTAHFHSDLWQESASFYEKELSKEGFSVKKEKRNGFIFKTVKVKNRQTAELLQKSKGTYYTLETGALWQYDHKRFQTACCTLAGILKEILPSDGTCVLVGLGNKNRLSDALGPYCTEHFFVSAPFLSAFREQPMRPTYCFTPGVAVKTGVDTALSVSAFVKTVKPDFVVAVDALSAFDCTHIGQSVQITDTGIAPGSGLFGQGVALNKQTLDIPVYAIGVPCLGSVYGLVKELLEKESKTEAEWKTRLTSLKISAEDCFMTVKDIEALVQSYAKLLGYGISLALQEELTLEDLQNLLV